MASLSLQTSALQGQGLFAKEDLSCRQPLTRRTVLFAWPQAAGPTAEEAITRIRAWKPQARLQFRTLASTTSQLYGLPTATFADVHDDSKKDGSALFFADVFWDHCFPSEPQSRVPVWYLLSGLQLLYNHSCTPNAEVTADPAAEHATVRAIKPIKARDEVTIAYTDICASRAQRRRSLGFDCRCHACSQNENVVKADDMELNIIRRGIVRLEEWRDGCVPDGWTLASVRERAEETYRAADETAQIVELAEIVSTAANGR